MGDDSSSTVSSSVSSPPESAGSGDSFEDPESRQKMLEKHDAAVRIQSFYRGNSGRKSPRSGASPGKGQNAVEKRCSNLSVRTRKADDVWLTVSSCETTKRTSAGVRGIHRIHMALHSGTWRTLEAPNRSA